MPTEMAIAATTADVLDISPTDAQANTPVRTAARVDSRNRNELSGLCGAFALRTISKKPVVSAVPARPTTESV
jgi:hypothetical protein